MSAQKFDIEKGSYLLEEINITAPSKNENFYNRVKLFGQVDKSWLINADDYQYKTIYDFIYQKAGSHYIGVNNSYGLPMVGYYLDGQWVPVEEISYVEDIQIQNVYRIDLKKTDNRLRREFYFIYQKVNRAGFRPGTTGQAILELPGFQKPNEFYSPNYTSENVASELPDQRTTLFWSPSVVVEDGEASINFFTCDNLADYAIFVEGITKNGNILSGVKQFSVTEFNSAKE
jgi:hypothetical protein